MGKPGPKLCELAREVEDSRFEFDPPTPLLRELPDLAAECVDLVSPAVLMRDLARLRQERPLLGCFPRELRLPKPCLEFRDPAPEAVDEWALARPALPSIGA